MKIAPIVNTHYDTCRPSSIFASMDAAISVAWLTTSRGKTSASGLALLISSAVGDIKSFSMQSSRRSCVRNLSKPLFTFSRD